MAEKEHNAPQRCGGSSNKIVPPNSGGEQTNLDDLSLEKLEYIVSQAEYRSVLEGLLQPQADQRGSAEHTSSDCDSADNTIDSERSTDHTRSSRLKFSGTSTRRANPSSSSSSTSSSSSGRKRLRQGDATGGGQPSRKRARRTSSAKRSSQANEEPTLLKQCFNPTLEREDKEEFKAQVPSIIQKYLEEHFRRPLSKEERTAMLKRHPKPDTEVMAPPKLDNFIADFGGRKVDKARDAQLAKIQGALLYAANPLTNLWSELIQQKLSEDTEAAVPVADVMDILQRSLVLLGNANSLISETRRENVLESVHPSLKKYAKGDFAKAESTLFGEEFKDNLVKKVEADSAISKAVNIVNRCTSSSAKLYQRPPRNDHSFHGSRASQYGAASGRRRSPYGYQGKGKYTPGKSYIRKGNIFDRLGSNQTEKRSGNNPNHQPQHK